MYRQFFGLRERPFDLTANPKFLFLSNGHREALSVLQYGLEGDKGITLLIGDAGTGKTTLVRMALEQQPSSKLLTVYLNNPTMSRQEFYEFLTSRFRLDPSAALSKPKFLRELEHALIQQRERGGMAALVVDEAQAIPTELLEEIRLLANLESTTSKLLSVVFTGQPELAARLNDPVLRPLKQRVALRVTLPPFNVRETAAYVAKRIRVAGGDAASMFTREAVEMIHHGAQGIPRTISVICDNSLITAFALRAKPADADIVSEVCSDLDLQVAPPSVPVTPVPQPALRPVAVAQNDGLLGTPRPLSVVAPIAQAPSGTPLPPPVERRALFSFRRRGERA